jgi:hypothetical protein
MNCIICAGRSDYYFSKEYVDPPYNDFMKEIGTVEYYKCETCGFVLSKTHSELDPAKWVELNFKAHTHFEDSPDEKIVNQPPYAQQALMLLILSKNGMLDITDMLDFAAGYGTLSKILSKYFNVALPVYDPYVQDAGNVRYVQASELRRYNTVLNSAMLEHITQRKDIDDLNNLVADDGCLVIHTLICENIPKDPNWFYLKPPVHTAFHTNKSMTVLMDQWGYKSSIYCPGSKSWILFKKDNGDLKRLANLVNEELQTVYVHYKPGFVDYWKGF